MSEMVERVAKAIWNDDELWATLPRAVKDDKMKRARTVIEAMLAPTSEMLSAGMTAADDALDSDYDSGPDGEGYNSYSYLRSDAPASIWQAMLTAALA